MTNFAFGRRYHTYGTGVPLSRDPLAVGSAAHGSLVRSSAPLLINFDMQGTDVYLGKEGLLSGFNVALNAQQLSKYNRAERNGLEIFYPV